MIHIVDRLDNLDDMPEDFKKLFSKVQDVMQEDGLDTVFSVAISVVFSVIASSPKNKQHDFVDVLEIALKQFKDHYAKQKLN